MIRSKAATIVMIVFVAFFAVILLGQLLGVPLGLGFVETGSMAPTLEPGDGFVALPPALVGEVGTGDVVTFDAEEIEGGALTTHRIVDETPEGYITRGDANPFTDQDGGEPPVQDHQIAAVAWQPGGEVLRIPALGSLVFGLQSVFGGLLGTIEGIPVVGSLAAGGVGSMMILFGVSILALSVVFDYVSQNRGTTQRSRARPDYLRVSTILVVLLLIILVPVTATMVLPGGVHDVTIVSTSSPTDDPTRIAPGESSTFDYEITSQGIIPLAVVLEPASEGVTVEQRMTSVRHGQTEVNTVTLHAPEETGAYDRAISERQYIHVLPAPVLLWLHDIHPWVAILSINAIFAIGVLVAVAIGIGFRPLRLRSRSRDIPWTDRLKQRLR